MDDRGRVHEVVQRLQHTNNYISARRGPDDRNYVLKVARRCTDNRNKVLIIAVRGHRRRINSYSACDGRTGKGSDQTGYPVGSATHCGLSMPTALSVDCSTHRATDWKHASERALPETDCDGRPQRRVRAALRRSVCVCVCGCVCVCVCVCVCTYIHTHTDTHTHTHTTTTTLAGVHRRRQP